MSSGLPVVLSYSTSRMPGLWAGPISFGNYIPPRRNRRGDENRRHNDENNNNYDYVNYFPYKDELKVLI
ncbi:hypothetical protein DPMN_165921 [Dreissena polymorpha]|uniref:Uncharacterized protein n=1 Tax=Dreissena polymorpha TaxID=45954 RepID=A0A9D4IX42_DREPO|nr:hypothetical protein DPMN_165921 [Dreissena polymorpha]